MCDRSVQPVLIPQRGAKPQQFIIGNDETELELSVESRSFSNRVNDQVRKWQNDLLWMLQKTGKNILRWEMFMSVTMESAVFMGKNDLNNCHSIANTKDLTLKQMFDISTRLVSEQDEISVLETIVGKIIHGNTCLWLVKKESSIFNARKSTSFRNDAWEPRLGWFKSSPEYRNFDRIDSEPMDFEWNIFPGFNTLQLSEEVKSLLLKSGETPENFTRRIIFMWMFNDISCGSRDNEEECTLNAKLVSLHAKRFGKRTMAISWSWFWKEVVLYQRGQSKRNLGQYGGKDVVGIRRKWMSNFPCYNSIVQRSTQKQKSWKIVNTPYYFSHNCFCKSAQSLRSCHRNVWRVRNPSRSIGATRCERAIKFLIRAKRNQDRSTFGLWWPG